MVVEPLAPLLERDVEIAAVRAAVDAAAGGRGSVVEIEGPAGIGKTSLLRIARGHAHRCGVRVLAARPGPLETGFAFGVVRTLFEPAVTATPDLLSSGPARLAAPVVTAAAAGGPAVTGERLHALYWLTVALTDAGPVAILLDDAHWADLPSLQALSYLARRAEELPLAVLLAVRTDTAAAGPDLIGDDPATVRLRPAPLSRPASDRLVHAALGPATASFLTACHDAAQGVPMLLGALLTALRDDAVRPDDSGLDAVRRRAQTIIAAFVLAKLRHVPPPAAALARAAAVLGSAARLPMAATLAGLPPDTALDAATALVGAGLLRPGRPLTFAHPLIAEAVTAHMSIAERHRDHLRTAHLFADHGADPEWTAAHLLAVEPMADPWVTDRLREAAAAALGKGAPASAVTYLQRAVDEPVEQARRFAVLCELGTAQIAAGDGAGFRTLREAADRAPDPPAAARVALALSRAARSGGSYAPAEAVVLAAAEALGNAEPDLLAALQAELALANRIGTAPGHPTAVRVGELADLAAGRGEECTSLLLRVSALAPLRDPAASRAAVPLADRIAARLATAPPPDAAACYPVLVVLAALERLPDQLAAVDALIDAARRNGQVLDLGVALTSRTDVYLRLGRLGEAEEDARLSDRLALGYDRPEFRRHAQAALLHCLTERGSLEDAEAELVAGRVPATMAQLLHARARLRLAQHRPDEALADLETCAGLLARRQVRHPNHVPWQAWRVIALLRLGREAQARDAAAEALSVARAFSSARACGLALWASGLVEQSPDILADAVAVLRGPPAPIERARALIDLGATLRRANRRTEARAPLREGLQLASDHGADSLVDTARLELAASGVRLRRRAVSGMDALTPTERRIVERAAAGATNREIAQALFITSKTVENHLGNAYRKLTVSGRRELAAALG